MPATGDGRTALDPRTPVLVGVGTASGDAEAVELMARRPGPGGRRRRLAPGSSGWPTGSPSPRGAGPIPTPAGWWPTRWGHAGPGPTWSSWDPPAGTDQRGAGRHRLGRVRGGRGGGRRGQTVGRATRTLGRKVPGRPNSPGVVPDVVRRRPGPLLEPVEVAHRLWDPVQQYAMIDNALRAAEGRTLAEHRAEVAALWARFNRRGPEQPRGRLPRPRWTPAQIDTPSPTNRPLAFPYNKWHSTQWTVNQAAALLLCSVETASRLGVPPDRWVFPLVGLESSHAVSLLRRREPHAWPAMEVLAQAAGLRLGRAGGRGRHHRGLQLLPGRRAGAAAGPRPGPDRHADGDRGDGLRRGPVQQLRAAGAWPPWRPGCGPTPARSGVVTTVSGLLTKPGIGVWSARPDGRPPLLADLAVEAESATGTVEVVEDARRLRGRGHRRHLHGDLRGHGAGPHRGPLRHRRRASLRGGERGRRPGRPRRGPRADRVPGPGRRGIVRARPERYRGGMDRSPSPSSSLAAHHAKGCWSPSAATGGPSSPTSSTWPRPDGSVRVSVTDDRAKTSQPATGSPGAALRDPGGLLRLRGARRRGVAVPGGRGGRRSGGRGAGRHVPAGQWRAPRLGRVPPGHGDRRPPGGDPFGLAGPTGCSAADRSPVRCLALGRPGLLQDAEQDVGRLGAGDPVASRR